ncbi:transcriptional regulatory protein moc3 [Staphylotrichum tortipilum]|uniref:Transcriptional regulatory protein moc3 n=1 Tax=Staphylotrichum tortipilum TaxID=2831512 RepID=A0AAN6RVL1_9PEZI|nr:transcriptional regulatory protein moc3 [Staphylotrichum longicolle]
MDRPLPVAPDDGDLAWSDSQSMNTDSDDAPSSGLPSPWLGSPSAGSTSVSASSSTAASGFAHTGQLSPVSDHAVVGLPLPTGRAAYHAAAGSARSSASLASSSPQSTSSPLTTADPAGRRLVPLSVRPQPWLLGCPRPPPEHTVAVAPARARARAPDVYGYGRPSFGAPPAADDVLAVPKLEPPDGDHDFCMGALQENPQPPPLAPPSQLSHHPQGGALGDPKLLKRPRGRPRKHPFMPPSAAAAAAAAASKITKGRSKTGCLTCRKRKKKCDEAKPRCMNCEKNAVVCEGYPEKQIWKSGRERAEEERLRFHRGFPSITIQPLFHALETIEDRIFWKHYNEHLSAVLTVEGDHRNAFNEMMIPVAVKHQGLMHSILSLASKHIDLESPRGIAILGNNPNTTLEALRERSLYHHGQARLKFYDDVEFTNGKPNTDDKTLVSARYGQMLCFLLEALVEGSPRGEHRLHLTAYRSLVSTSPPEDSPFSSFIAEMFQYHILADELLHTAVADEATPPPPQQLPPAPTLQHPPRLVGITDGLLGLLSPVTAIRNGIRRKLRAQIDPPVDYLDIYPAEDISAAIQAWTPSWPPGDSRYRASLLYQQMIWIYLDRTVYVPPSPPVPSPPATPAAAPGPQLHDYPSSHARPGQSVANTPPLSAATSCASSPRVRGCGSGSGPGPNPSGGRRRPRGGEEGTGEAATADSRPDSPPPARQPPDLNPRVTLAVDQSLALLESFQPDDPCQTLLLLPCFLVGTACFSPAKQERVRAAIGTARAYTGLGNADLVARLLDEVWRLMAAGDWIAAWDWPGVAERLGLDFIPA